MTIMSKTVTRRAAIALAGAMALTLAGCGAATQADDAGSAPSSQVEQQAPAEGDGTGSASAASSDIADAIVGRDTTDENPAALGQWVEMARYCAADDTYHTVYVRVTGVVTQTDDASAIDAAIAKNNELGSDWSQIDLSSVTIPDDVEPCLMTYEVYVPDDFPVSDYGGITEPSLYFSEDNVGGGGIPTGDGATYIGLGSNNEQLYTDATNLDTEYKPGETYAFTDLFFMVKGYDGFVFQTDSYDAGTTDTDAADMYDVYFVCK